MASQDNDSPKPDDREDQGAGEEQKLATSILTVDTGSATPDTTPSRRSARKKQSTFSSDFEYYTPIGRKNQPKEEETKQTPLSQKGKSGMAQQQNEEDVDAGEDEESMKPMKRKVAVRKQKNQEGDNDFEDEGAEEAEEDISEEEPQEVVKKPRGRPKATATKNLVKAKAVKGPKKNTKKKMEEEDDSGKPLLTAKGQKRKKPGPKPKGKKTKVSEEDLSDLSSDDEDSTPISQLKAQLQKEKSAEASSPLAQNLVKKFLADESDMSSSPEIVPTGQKRKLIESDEDAPPKKIQTAKLLQIEKLAPVLAGLVKRFPPTDLGLIKRSQSEIAAKTVPPKPAPSHKDKPEKPVKTESEDVGINSNTISSSSKGKIENVETVKDTRESTSVKTETVNTVKMENSDVGDKVIKSETTGKAKSLALNKSVHAGKITKTTVADVKSGVMYHKGQLINSADGKVKFVKSAPSTFSDKEKVKIEPGGPKPVSLSKNNGSRDKAILKNIDKKVVSDLKEKKLEQARSKPDGSNIKSPLGGSKKNFVGAKPIHKSEQGSSVDDLLKRGIIHKKKSHQPFGNKKSIPKVISKDGKPDFNKDTSEKPEQVKKKVGVMEKKKPVDGERKKSTDGLKQVRDRSVSGDSVKGERRKSSDGVKRSDSSSGNRTKKTTSLDDDDKKKPADSDGPPPLIPATALGKPKQKHKPEHEVPVDLTMMDLFKPDGLIIHDQQKKDEAALEIKSMQEIPALPKSQYTQDLYSSQTFVKPENIHHVLIEHQYSKPSSPVTPKTDEKNVSMLSDNGRDDDIESVSHKQGVIMDVTLPDQILEESEEPLVQESLEDFQETWPENIQELQQMVSKRDPGDRQNILESLDSELRESGSDFVIVGQVEIERTPAPVFEEVKSSLTPKTTTTSVVLIPSVSKPNKEENTRKRKDSEKNTDIVKSNTEAKKSAESKKEDAEKGKRKKKALTEGSKKSVEDKEDGDTDEGEDAGFEDDENDQDWEPNDPDTLYCVCRKAHNNRFMICCDKCEEWYHGTCVGISRARGKEMEEKEEEYICPVCSKVGGISKIEKAASSKETKISESPTVGKSKLLQRCIGRKCNKTPRPSSVYCSNECIMSHAQESLKAIREEQMRQKAKEKHRSSSDSSRHSSNSSSKAFSSSDTVEVVERETGKVIKGSNAPTQKGLHRWLEQHPTYEVVQPRKHRSSSAKEEKHRDSDRENKSDKDRKSSSSRDKREEKSQHSSKSRHDGRDSGKKVDGERRASSASHSTSRSGEKKEDGPNQIRLNVRTALRDSLNARVHEADDIMMSGSEIKNLAVTIEEELFSLFNDTGHKYRMKYRSLIFNIKDQKNKGLFRKILTGKIKPNKLVLMSTEELASRELAKWREQESKHQLEMIQKTEIEALKESAGTKHVRKKTHKGEVEVEDEDLSILETRLEEKKDPEPEAQEDQNQTPVIDTTDQHRAHLFDLNCKVCTGKIVPGPEEQAAAAAAAAKVKIAHLPPQEDAGDKTPIDKEDYVKAEEIVKEAMRFVLKTEQEVASLPKIVSSSPKPDLTPIALSPKITPRRESSSSASSVSSSASKKTVVVRSPDSALQSGLEAKSKFTPTGPMLWKGFVSMQDVAKFFTSAYRVSGPTEHITIPDTIHIMGRISPDHMWDYLSKIRQAGSKDLTVVRFIPGSDDEKVAYVHLYSYLNSRGRCGVAGNPNKQIKDFYVVPLASHSKIPRTLLPFDGPGLEENRPHMLIGILVRQRGKHSGDSSDNGSTGSSKPSTPTITTSTSSTTTNTATKRTTTGINRDPRLAKLAAAKEASPKASPTGSGDSTPKNAGEIKVKPAADENEAEYIPMPIKPKGAVKPVAEYIPTPTVKKKEKAAKDKKKDEKKSASDESSGSAEGKEKHHHHHHHHHHHKDHHHSEKHRRTKEESKTPEDDSEPYSPGKEAEPYSPGQEAAADEPYDPEDESLMDDSGMPIVSSTSSTASSSIAVAMATISPPASTLVAAAVSVSTNSVPAVSRAEPVAAQVVTVGLTETTVRNEDLVEKMARSNDPQEISSLMIKALSTASTPHEQQKLLVDLTKQVEERKLQLAEAARRGAPLVGVKSEDKIMAAEAGSSVTGEKLATLALGDLSGKNVLGLVSSVSSSSGAESQARCDTAVAPLPGHEPQTIMQDQGPVSSSFPNSIGSLFSSSITNTDTSSTASSIPQNTLNTLPSNSSSDIISLSATPSSKPLEPRQSVVDQRDSGGIKFSFLKTLTKPTQPVSVQAAQVFSLESSDLKPKLTVLNEDTSSQQSFASDSSESMEATKVGESSTTEIPDALKALMNDVLGNTQFSSLERRRKMLLKKEADKAEKAVKYTEIAAKEEQEKKLSDDQEEMPKRLNDKMETKLMLDCVKMADQSITNNSSNMKGSREVQQDTVEKPPAPAAPPTIDELLERLKKGGFQFPVQKPDSSVSSSSTSDTNANSLITSESPAPASFTADKVVNVSSLSSVDSSMDVDLRQSSLQISLPSTPPTAITPQTLTPGSTEPNMEPKVFGDYDARIPPSLLDRDDRSFYQDRDERLYRHPPPSAPKHPLDPLAFPPLPIDPRGYPPRPHLSNLPPPSHGPLHPRYPLPPAEPHIPYHPTPRANLSRPPPSKGRAQPPPPGTEFEKPAGVIGITNDFPPTDVDFRSRNRPPAPPDQTPPPLPPQPPPPLPPLPGNRGAQYSLPPPGDVDFRSGDPYSLAAPPHHPDYRSQHSFHSRGRPYHRH